jgi:hypothetical protein
MVHKDWVFAGALASMFVASRGEAETIVATGAQSATWTLAGSPYLVTTDVAFGNLTVEAGTVVRTPLHNFAKVLVSGHLDVNGTKARPVIFEGDAPGSVYDATHGGVRAATFDVQGAIFRHGEWALQGGTPGVTSRVSQSVFEECYWAIELTGDIEVDRVRFLNNVTAVHSSSASGNLRVTNSEIVGGIGMFLGPVNVTVESTTFASLATPIYASRPATIRNSILSRTTSQPLESTIDISHSTIWPAQGVAQNWIAGDGMRYEDPLFVSATDRRLSPTSPCIDSGSASVAPDRDLDGKHRPYGAGIDRGAYEFGPNDDDGGEGGGSGTGGAAGEGGASEGGAGATTTGGAAGNGASGAGTAGASTGGANASGGASGAGPTTNGGAGAPSTGGASGSSSSDNSKKRVETSGCGCRTPGGGASNGARAVLCVLLAGIALLRRRNRGVTS